jgi:integrase
MAIEKVGVYRKYHGKIPKDKTGKPLPKEIWPKKRPSRWAVRWFGSDGKRYSKSFKTRKEAEQYANEQQSQVQKGKADIPASISLREFVSEHREVMRHQVARSTLCDQMRALRMFMKHIGKNIPLKEVTARHAESFIAVRLKSGVKTATANKDIRTLRRVFNLAIEPRGYISSKANPFRNIRQRKISAKPVRYITPEEFQALLNATTDLWWKTFLSVAYTSAARTGELLNLMWKDVDFEMNRIRIVCKEAEGNLRSWEPKDHEGRVLPVPAEVIQLLADLQVTSAEGCPYAFIPEWRWKHIKQAQKAGKWNDDQALLNNLNRRFNTLRRRAEVAKCTLHDLRRSCITNWAKVLPIHVVQKLAGHSDIKTTRLYYLAVEESDLERARKVQEKILRNDQTDPLLTHFGKNEGFCDGNKKGQQT